ncbi:MAG: glycoside hydrolase family 3 C-terminal domain-containing protein [Clostridia bacterium]|nr:glycoside hydrolase family 3 C-terminal domain-containing protein [Clostridia bacterium]
MKAKSKLVSIIVSAVAFVVVLALNIAIFATPLGGLLDKFVVGYKNGGSDSAARAEGAALAEQIQEEGTVLVKNETESGEALLPLSKNDVTKVNVFGWASTDWVISGSGSGQVKRIGAVDLLEALDEAGIAYNTELSNMYEKYRANREFSIMGGNGGNETDGNPSTGSLHSFNYEFSRLYEPGIDDRSYYTSEMLENALAYSETALVVIGRVSGESNDSPKVQYKGVPGSSRTTGKPSNVDTTRTYLEISTEEEALLKYVGSNYENVIVLINSTNVMELGFMDTIPGLDSCLIVATTGTVGAKAIPSLIYGEKEVPIPKLDKDGKVEKDEDGEIVYEKNDDGSIKTETVKVSPSGRTADTYAYDLTTSPTYVDTGSGNDTTNFYTNGNGLYPTKATHTNGSSGEPYRGVAYTDYRENIYVGYKWYETADIEGFWNSDFAKDKWGIENGYEDVVQYPFGHGLSYTDFTWKITYLEQPNGSTLTPDDIIKVGVQVTNVGEYPGQDVVQLYYGTEYTSSGIEKSAVNLAAFAKTTQVIQPNESAYVELELTVSDMASYDAYEVKVPGGGYILEEGEYYLSLRTDAHTLAGTKVVGGDKSVYNKDTLVYNISKDTRCLEEASNRFTGENTTDGVAIDGNSDGTASITYLSRTNFEETFPAEKSANREMHDSIKALNLYTKAMATAWEEEHSDAEPVTFGDTTQGYVVYKNGQIDEKGIALGLDYDHEDWDAVLNRITRSEMTYLVLHGYTETHEIKSIGKPTTLDLDGPNQIGSFGPVNNTTGFSSIVLAQTWNLDLAYSMGLAFGTECADAGVTGWYGPGVNIHRSPFGGRNYEYYSEDALISGLMCAKVVTAAKNKGVFCWLKHICLYETESGRDGMYTWVTEQALREIYIRPFELAVKKGGSTAMMTSYGRIGAVWTGGSSALLNEVVRGEWGFKGAFLTDYSDHTEFMNTDHMIRNGGDIFMRVGGGSFNNNYNNTSNAFNQALRGATKNIVYMWLNALATNADYNDKIEQGIIQDSIVIPTSPELNFRWYIPVVIALDVIVVAGCGCWLFLTLRKKEM